MFLLLQSGLVACVADSKDGIEPWREAVKEIDPRLPIEQQFATIAASAISHEIVEGVQFALIENGKVLATDAFGVADRESGRPMSVDTRINVASISKAFTAWGFMHLAERESLDIDAPIKDLLNDNELYTDIFSDVDVTPRMLLSHTGGLSGASVPVTPAEQVLPSLADILRGRSTVDRPRIEAPPGSRFSYSGLGYLVIQKVVEQQTQISFDTFMSDALLKPAQMDDSSFTLDREALDRVAVYYRSDGRRREPYHLPGAAGGLHTTANDMARFMSLYTDSGVGRRRQILSDAGFAELLIPVAEYSDYEGPAETLSYALGHYSYETPEGVTIVFHSGGNPGLRALMVIAPDDGAGFFAVANDDRGSHVMAELLKFWGRHNGLTVHEHF